MICYYRQDTGTTSSMYNDGFVYVDSTADVSGYYNDPYTCYSEQRVREMLKKPQDIWDLIALKTMSAFCFINYVPPYLLLIQRAVQYTRIFIRKLMFSKSGYLPKRIRRIRKSK